MVASQRAARLHKSVNQYNEDKGFILYLRTAVLGCCLSFAGRGGQVPTPGGLHGPFQLFRVAGLAS